MICLGQVEWSDGWISLFIIRLGWSVATRSMQVLELLVMWVGWLTSWDKLWSSNISCMMIPYLSLLSPWYQELLCELKSPVTRVQYGDSDLILLKSSLKLVEKVSNSLGDWPNFLYARTKKSIFLAIDSSRTIVFAKLHKSGRFFTEISNLWYIKTPPLVSLPGRSHLMGE